MALLSLWLVCGCRRFEDCELYGTCKGTLREAIRVVAGDAGAACATCIAQTCSDEEARCAGDYACNRAARCMAQPDPVHYQDCLTALFVEHYSDGTEPRPWEGDVGNFRGACLDRSCSDSCERGMVDWRCEYDDVSHLRDSIVLEVAVRVMDVYKAVPNAIVRFCSGDSCPNMAVTGPDGRARLENVRELFDAYLQIEAEDQTESGFPPTLYYPGQFGTGAVQPIAVYLVPMFLVEDFNEKLKFGKRLLSEVGQAVIWPDSCNKLGPLLTPDLSFAVEGVPLPLCRDISGAEGSPCIWYSDASGGISLSRTGERGGGIVGLPENSYTARVCDAQDRLVSRRPFLMKKGWLTIVRTWPLTSGEKGAFDAGASIPCASPPSAP